MIVVLVRVLKSSLLLSLAVLSAHLSEPVNAETIVARTYTEPDGLPGSWVADVAQGADGRMWFLAHGGIAAYDGTSWETYGRGSGDPLRRGFRFALQPDGRGWALLNDGTLLRFDGVAWRGHAEPPFEALRTMLSDFVVVPDGREGTPVIATLEDGLFVLGDEGYEHWEPGAGAPGDRLHALLVVDDELWAGTDQGLWSFDGERWTRRFLPPPGLSPAVRGIERDRDSRVYLAGTDWIGRWAPPDFEVLASGVGDAGWLRFPGVELAPDGLGGVYFGNAGGLWHLDGLSRQVSSMGRHDGLVGDGVLSFFSDREDNLWIATGVGVSKLAGATFHGFDRRHGLAEDEVTAITELADGEIVLAHKAALTFFRQGIERTIALPDGPVPRVLDLERDADGSLWIAGAGLGLLRLAPSGQVEHVGAGGANPADWISSVRFDERGDLWLCGPSGIHRFEQGRIVRLPAPVEGLRGVRRILRGRSGALYFATGGFGLLVRRGERWVQARHRSDPSANDVFAVFEHEQRVLVGTRGGLFLLDNDEIVDVDPSVVPRVARPVYSILQDMTGQVWMGTNLGVYAWTPGGVPRHYSTRHGLPGLETNRAASFVDSDGRVWVGTDRGVAVYPAERRHETAPELRVELLGAEARGEPIDPATDSRLRHDRNDLTFRLRALSFVDERQLQFRTRLAGLEDDWAVHDAAQTRLVVRYPRLPSGSYRLEAQARGVRDSWGPVTRSSQVTIDAPIWRRGWFLALAISGSAMIALAAHSYFSQRRYARRLEREVSRQTHELRSARQGVESERERLAAVLGSIGDGVIALDGEDRVVLGNPAAERMLGLDASRVRDGREVMAGRDANGRLAFEQWLEELRRLPERHWCSHPLILAAADGSLPTLELAAAPYRPGTQRPGIVLAFRDVSERFRVEAERERTRRIEGLGVLAGGIAHDFNNILMSVLGNLSLIRDETALGALASQRIRDAEDATQRAHRLARQLITFSQGGDPITASVSIADLLRQTARFSLSGSGVECAIEVPDAIWPVEAESDQIQQVFENLLVNARQSMRDRGRIRVRAQNVDTRDGVAHPELERGRYVQIDVEDHGRGIRADHLERLFEPYFTTKTGGNGLGLATSHSIVKRHGGILTVRSTEHEGSVFSVYLPASDDPAPVDTVDTAPRTVSKRRRILVLEDEEVVANVLVAMLTNLGHEVAIESDGDAAVDRCRRELQQGRRFEVAILDLTIPGGRGGADVVGELVRLDPELCSIATSGYSDGGVLARYAEHGFRAVLPKPYKLGDLRSVIEDAVASRPAGTE